ncbi:MAG: glycosyltransferase [Kiritimatiellae bacterium]|nr:glycosyltransferase [Kiritimatiellia bacterium]
MRILHLINSTRPEGGGPIESILQAASALAADGHVFEIASLDEPGAPWLSNMTVPVHALGPAVTPYRYSPRYLPWLRDHIREWDAAIVHGVWLFPSFAAWRACRAAQVPYFVYTHGLLDPTLKRVFPLKHLKKAAWWRLIEHKVVRDATAVFFTCEEEKRLAGQSFKPFECQPEIVPYCVGEPPGDPAVQIETFLRKYPECRGQRNILFLSRIHPKKGCDLLIEAFAGAAAKADGVRLVMAGPDVTGWQAELEELARRHDAADRITWTGMLSGDLKWGAFRAADAFALPSHQENFGIAVVEALACGTPVLISSKINIWREIEDDGAGLIASDDAAGTEVALGRWLAMDEVGRAAMREGARRCFERRFRSKEAAGILLGTLRACGVDERGNAEGGRCPVSAIILTLNEEANMRACLESLAWVDEVVVVDSGSHDRTVALAGEAREDVRVFEHEFRDFGDQRNWALDHTDPKNEWILFVDADERITPACAAAIRQAVAGGGAEIGYYLANRYLFLGRWIRHCTLYPSWQLRLLKRGHVRFQKEGHGQREVADGPLGYIREPYDHYGLSKGEGEWLARHKAYAVNEVDLLLRLRGEKINWSRLWGRDPVARRRALKQIAARMPCRPVMRFAYMYLWRGGFLDGRAGWRFCRLRWVHEMNVAARLAEARTLNTKY